MLKAQQEQQYSLYMANPYTLNPALSGTEDFVDLNLGGRYQWTGVEGSPTTYYLTAHGVVGKPQEGTRSSQTRHHWHGVGGYVYQDQTGPLKRSSISVSYAYNLQLSNNLRVSMGGFGGMKSLSANNQYWKNIDNPNDELFSSKLSNTLPDLAFGTLLYSDNFYVGASVFQLLGSPIGFSDRLEKRDSEGVLDQHFFITSGVKLPILEKVYFIPSFMLKSFSLAFVSVDINAKVEYTHRYWLGLSYRHLDSFVLMGGVYLTKRFEVNYGYDLTLSQLRKYNSGSHELVLSYHLSKSIITCPSKFW